MTNKEEIEDLQANTSDIRFSLLIVVLFVCLFFIIFAITLFNNCNKIDDLEETNKYQLSPAFPDGYVEECVYETVEKYEFVDEGKYTKTELLECISSIDLSIYCVILTDEEAIILWFRGGYTHYETGLYNIMCLSGEDNISSEDFDVIESCVYKLDKPHIRYWNESVCEYKTLVNYEVE